MLEIEASENAGVFPFKVLPPFDLVEIGRLRLPILEIEASENSGVLPFKVLPRLS
jgi:hypothetical protein